MTASCEKKVIFERFARCYRPWLSFPVFYPILTTIFFGTKERFLMHFVFFVLSHFVLFEIPSSSSSSSLFFTCDVWPFIIATLLNLMGGQWGVREKSCGRIFFFLQDLHTCGQVMTRLWLFLFFLLCLVNPFKEVITVFRSSGQDCLHAFFLCVCMVIVCPRSGDSIK